MSPLSDFEYFRALAMLLPRLTGVREGELIGEELLIIQEKAHDISRPLADEILQEIWNDVRDTLEKCDGDYDILLGEIGVEKLHCGYRIANASCGVKKYKNKEDDLSALCDFRGLSFVRPDPYHVSLIEEKKQRGESLWAEESAMLAAQALYRLCATARDREVEIRLLADNGQTAKEVIAYLKRLHVRGCVWLAADGAIADDALVALCALSDEHLRVRLEIVLGETDSARNFEKRLSALAALYPISLWHFGGVITQSPLFAAGHVLARRVICGLAFEIVDDKNEATAMVKAIFS